jgi:hypothetical protein
LLRCGIKRDKGDEAQQACAKGAQLDPHNDDIKEGAEMNDLARNTRMLKVTSLISVVLFILHVTGDISLGYEKGSVYPVIPIALVFLIGATILGDNLAGHIIMFLGGIASALMPVLHWKLYAVADKGALGYWFAAIVLSMGVTGAFGVVLAALVMWQTWKRRRAGALPR